jgi:3-dehydroquinate dehydratase type I
MICIPIIARNTEDALEKMAVAEVLGDALEIRLDLMDEFDLPRIMGAAGKPVLVTYRSQQEGGSGGVGPRLRAEYLLEAVREGADLVDVELSMEREWREKIFQKARRSRIIVSTHIMDGTPSHQELQRILEKSVATDAPIVKIVTSAKMPGDNLRVLGLIPEARKLGVGIIALCMGPAGRISRVFSLLMGGYLTFASLEAGQESATGQIPAAELREMLEYFRHGL